MAKPKGVWKEYVVKITFTGWAGLTEHHSTWATSPEQAVNNIRNNRFGRLKSIESLARKGIFLSAEIEALPVKSVVTTTSRSQPVAPASVLPTRHYQAFLF